MQAARLEARALHVLVFVGVKAYREALVAALNDYHNLRARGEALTREGLVETVESTEPGVIVVDASVRRGLETISLLRSRKIAIPVIALGVDIETSDIIVCAEAGAAGYVAADASVAELVDAINDVRDGRLACPPTIAFELFRMVGTQRPSLRPDADDFTPREQEVLKLLGSGQSNKEIARHLGISVSTVKNHVHHILEKSKACSRRHAARKSPFMLAPSNGARAGEVLVPSLL
jgi:two-component system, NarL family, nitrate/nitrite response regulator NarL